MISNITGTDLVYNIVEELLTGSIDGVSITAQVVSGGRAGSKMKGVVNPLLANNPYATGVKKKGTTPGGPTIMGKYHLKTHESKQKWIRLVPFAENVMHGRAGFAIHGRGNRGSDGCIVPALRGERLRLNKAVHDFQGTVVLLVTHVSYMLPAEVEYQLA